MHALFALLALAACGAPSSAQQSADAFALENVTVIDGTGAAACPGMTIVVRDGRIAELFTTGERPLDASVQRRDLGGRFVTPGLIDTHVHLATFDRGEVIGEILTFALQGGVTAVRDMGGNGPAVKALATRQRRGELVAPEIYYSALVTGPESDFWLNDQRTAYVSAGAPPGQSAWFRHVAATDDFARVAREARAFGATGIKVHSGFDAATLARLTEAARREGLQIWAHATVDPATPSDALASGVQALSHADMIVFENRHGADAAYWRRPYAQRMLEALNAAPAENAALGAALERMRHDNAIFEPTLFVIANASANAAPNESNLPRWRQQYAYAREVTRRAVSMGVAIAAGTDALGRESPWLHAELQLLVREGGLTPLEAIRAATSTAARVLGKEREFGAIAPGMRADLVVYERNPSADIRNTLTIASVVQRGRVYHRTEPMQLPPMAQAPTR